MNVGDWIDSDFSSKAHRLSIDGVDAICGFPLVVEGHTDHKLGLNTAVSRRCGTCKKHPTDYLRPTSGAFVGSGQQDSSEDWLARIAARRTTAVPIEARELAAQREFEAVCTRIQSELPGSTWAIW